MSGSTQANDRAVYQAAVNDLASRRASGLINQAQFEREMALLDPLGKKAGFSGSPSSTGGSGSSTNADPERPKIESWERISFRTADYKRTENPFNNSAVFPYNLERLQIPFVVFEIFETNTTQNVTTDGVLQFNSAATNSQASITAGLQQMRQTISNAVDTGIDATQTFIDGKTNGAATSTIDTAGQGINAAATKTLGVSADEIKSRIGNLFKNFSLARYSDDPVAQIALPMPDGVQTQYQHDYSTLSLTSAFGTVGFAAQAISSDLKNVQETDPMLVELGTKLGGSFFESFKSSEDLTNLIMFGATGKVVNPQMEMIYKTPQLRMFTFDFRLIPRNRSEAIEIKKIIDIVRNYSSPTFCGTTTGRYFTPPARFRFTFFDGYGNENVFLFKSKQCVVETFSIDFAPNGFATFDDNFPVETRIQLVLRETSIISSEDVGF